MTLLCEYVVKKKKSTRTKIEHVVLHHLKMICMITAFLCLKCLCCISKGVLVHSCVVCQALCD